MHILYLGDDPRKQWSVSREARWGGKEANTGGIRVQGTTCWGSVLLGPLSEGVHNMPELPHLKGKEFRVFLYQFPSFSG